MTLGKRRRRLAGVAVLMVLVVSCQKQGGRWSREWEEAFEDWQPSDKIMDVLEVKPGMVIGEIGAGNGRLAVKMARRVGKNGKVYANDIDEKALNFMRRRIQRENIENMEVIKGEVANPLFPAAELDLVYIVNTYEHLEKPVKILQNLFPALKPDGILAIIVTDPVKVNYAHNHTVTQEKVFHDVAQTGAFEPVRTETFLPQDNIYIFRLR